MKNLKNPKKKGNELLLVVVVAFVVVVVAIVVGILISYKRIVVFARPNELVEIHV